MTASAAALPRVQNNTHTGAGRADPYLAVLANVIGAGRFRRVLSFGCSEGFECISLAKAFPDASVYGCDVNPAMVAAAKSRCAGVARILPASADALAQCGPFDLITCFNVLCRYPATKGLNNIADVFPFALFEQLVGELDALVAPGGVLMLRNAQYFLQDTGFSPRYAPIPTPGMPDIGFLHRHAPDGARVTRIRYIFEDGEELEGAAGQARLDAAQAQGLNLMLLGRAHPILEPLHPAMALDLATQAFRKIAGD